MIQNCPRHATVPRFPIISLLLAITAIVAGAFATPAPAAQPAVQTDDSVKVSAPGAVLTVHFAPDKALAPSRPILEWIERSARAVAIYYGRFPVPEVNILIVATGGRGVKTGRALGGRNPYIRIIVGRDSTPDDLAKDWVMIHEMIHLAFPIMADRHDWISEGLAVYVESVARLQAGDLDEPTVWRGFVDGMQHGVPRPGDKGLDFTPTWGRKYWGGAIFCLFADLEIRKRTNGAKTLQDALRGLLAADGDFRKSWPIRKALETADAATGTTALMDLYDAWRDTPVDPELPALWRRLGVATAGDSVSFDDAAALAAVRKRIGRKPAPRPSPRS